VTNYHCGGPISAAFRKLQQDSDLRLLPVIGTAMILDEQRVPDWIARTFSYLPLPRDGSTNTGLPVHVNGAFALEANRKHVKWPSMIGCELRGPRDEHLDKVVLTIPIYISFMSALLRSTLRWSIGNVPPNFCQYLRQILMDMQNSFTVTLCWKFVCDHVVIKHPTAP